MTTWQARLRRGLSFQSIGAVYVLIGMIVLFSIWVPDTFPKVDTIRQVFNNNAIPALAALALIVPLASGTFDISVPSTMTLSGVMCTWYIVNTELPMPVCILIALGISLIVGCINGIVVVVFKIDALIGTLATGFLIQAVVKWRTGLRLVTSAELTDFKQIATRNVGRFVYPVFYVVVIAVVLWYVLEHTASGRRLYATGFNRDAARLAGVQTDRIRFVSLVTSAFLGGVAGIVLAARLGSGDPGAGGEYLLPAFAAVFLGATQLKGGRFNAWGTLIGIVLLGTGTTGLGLARPQDAWLQDTFKGLVLIASLAVTGLQVRKAGASPMRTLFRRWSGSRTIDNPTTPNHTEEMREQAPVGP